VEATARLAGLLAAAGRVTDLDGFWQTSGRPGLFTKPEPEADNAAWLLGLPPTTQHFDNERCWQWLSARS
jgi:hypothetical protein